MDFDEPLPGRVQLVDARETEDHRAFVGLVLHVAPDGRAERKQYGWPIALRADREGLRRTIRALHTQWLAKQAAPASDALLGQDL